MQRKPGQKSNALAFQTLGTPAARMRLAEKTLGGSTGGHFSIFLQLSKHVQARPSAGYPLRRAFLRPRRGASAPDSSSPSRCPPHRHGRRRSPGGTRNPCFHPFPPSRKTETSRPRPCPPPKHLSLVLRGHRC